MAAVWLGSGYAFEGSAAALKLVLTFEGVVDYFDEPLHPFGSHIAVPSLLIFATPRTGLQRDEQLRADPRLFTEGYR